MDGKEFSDIIAQASNWNFEGDCKILQWMEQLSRTLETRAKNAVESLDQLTTNINRAKIDLENTHNSLTALQYSQYVEMRCQEETTLETENVAYIEQKEKPSQQEVLQVFLQNNIKMLHNCHDKFSFLEESDEDDENTASAENCIYQPRNPYNERFLPHIYGTKLWKEQAHVGLQDDMVLDYSGDEKSEVYSISSSSSAESGGRESPESRLTGNTSQWTSSASLNNELINTSRTMKVISSISNTPSISSLPLDTTNNNTSAYNEPMPANAIYESDRNSETLPTISPMKKQRTLNLFDDKDYKNLISEIVGKTQSLENSKSQQFQTENSKIDLFASNESLSNQENIQPRNSAQAQQISSANLFDSPIEPVYDLFQDFQETEFPKTVKNNSFTKTKLSTKNLFDDEDEDADFLNIFAKKCKKLTITSDTKHVGGETTKDVLGNDELDRQEMAKDQIAATCKSSEINKNIRTQNADNPSDITKSIKTTKSLFFDDNEEEDDLFARSRLLNSNILKTQDQPKHISFPAFLSTEPPEDNGNQHDKHKTIEKTLEIGDDTEDDFSHMFGSKKTENITRSEKSNLKQTLFADDNQSFTKSVTQIGHSQLQDHRNQSKISIPTKIQTNREKFQDQNVKTIKPNPINEIYNSDDDFDELFQSKNKQQPEVDINKELAKQTQVIVSESSISSSRTEAVNLRTTETENSVTEDQAFQTDLAREQIFDKNEEVVLKTPIETEYLIKENSLLSNVDLFESSSTHNANNSSVEVAEPPLDKLHVCITKEKTDHVEEEGDDFLRLFNKEKPTLATSLPRLFDDDDKTNRESAAIQKGTEIFNSKSPEKPTKTNGSIDVETTQLTQQTNLAESLKPVETRAQPNLTPLNDSEEPKTLPTNLDMEPTSRHKAPVFDHFSPLFSDEPPDDDDFLQSMSISSNSNIVPTTQYGADNDFYEPAKQSFDSDTKTEDSQQTHTGYNIRLFDELPPDDNEQENKNVNDLRPEMLKHVTTKPNTLSNLFASDKFATFMDEPALEDPVNIFDESSTANQFDELTKSFATKVQTFEEPEKKSKEPSLVVSKLKLPKIDINVQALLPNAGGKSINRNIKTEKSIEQQHVETKPYYPETKAVQPQTTAEHYANKPEIAHILPSLCKSRVRVPAKRKSSTRAGRQESYRQTLKAENQAHEYQKNVNFEKSSIGDGLKVKNSNESATDTKQTQSKLMPTANLAKPNAKTSTPMPQTSAKSNTPDSTLPLTTQTQPPPSLKQIAIPLPQPTSSILSISPTAATNSATATIPQPPVHTNIKTTSKLFSDSDDNDDDAFFGKLVQPKIPIAFINKSATLTPQLLHEDSDDDLFASNAVKTEKIAPTTAVTKPKALAANQTPVESKPHSVIPKTVEKSVVKAKALFDSDSSNDEDNEDDLFKAPKPTFQKTTKNSTAKPIKPNAGEKSQAKTQSLFSDSDDDDNLFGSSASKPKNTRVVLIGTKDPSISKQQKPQNKNDSSIETSDNPLADLL